MMYALRKQDRGRSVTVAVIYIGLGTRDAAFREDSAWVL